MPDSNQKSFGVNHFGCPSLAAQLLTTNAWPSKLIFQHRASWQRSWYCLSPL